MTIGTFFSYFDGKVHALCLQFTVIVVVFCFWLFFSWSDLGLKGSTKKEKLTTIFIELDSPNLLLKSKLHLLLRSLLRNA